MPDPRALPDDPLTWLARAIALDLFTNGCGDLADRLVLTSKDGRDLGGWCRMAVEDQVRRLLEECHCAPPPR